MDKPLASFQTLVCPILSHKPSAIVHIQVQDTQWLICRENSTIERWIQKVKVHTYYLPNQEIPFRLVFSSNLLIVFTLSGQVCYFQQNVNLPLKTINLKSKNLVDVQTYQGAVFVLYSDSQIDKYSVEDHLSLQASYQITNEEATAFSVDKISFLATQNSLKKLTSSFFISISLNNVGKVNNILNLPLYNQVALGCEDGSIKLIDCQFCQILTIFRHHQGPILASVFSNDKIYYSGSDSKVCVLSYFQNKWQLMQEFRGQSHDIKTLAISQGMLLSGGITTDICQYKINQQDVKFNHLNHIPNNSQFKANKQKNNIYIWFNDLNSIQLYKNKKNQYTFLVKLASEVGIINTFDVNSSNEYFIYSHFQESSCFQVQKENGTVKFNRLCTMKPLQHVVFIEMYTAIGVDNENAVRKIKFHQDQVSSSIRFRLENDIKVDKIIKCNQTYIIMDCLNNRINFFNSKGDQLKMLNQSQQLINMELLQNNSICFQFANSSFYFINGETLNLTSWSKQNMNKLPKDLVNRPIVFRGVVQNKSDNKKLIMFANTHLLTVHLRGKPADTLRKDLINLLNVNNDDFQLQGGFTIGELDFTVLTLQQIQNSENYIMFTYKFEDMELPGAIIGRKYLAQ